MEWNRLWWLLLPFIGTTLGAGCVFFMKKNMHPLLHCILTGFTAGVMVAASIWSLLIPAIEQSEYLGWLRFLPPVVGFWLGILLLLGLDKLIPHFHMVRKQQEGLHSKLSKCVMLVLAVTIHNIPEGMAVGAVFVGWLSGTAGISFLDVMALTVGIAIQNIPEGAIISMPLMAEGMGKKKAFFSGVLSGVVEPLGAFLMILAVSALLPILPYFLSMAAGAMLYVVVEEFIPEMAEGNHIDIGTVFFAVGFTLMMTLDVVM